MFTKESRRAVAALFILGFTWGVSGITTRIAHGELSSLHQLAIQCWIATVAMAAIRASRGMALFPPLPPRRALAPLFVRVAVGGIAGSILMIEAYPRAPLANVAFVSTVPVGAIWGWVILGQRVSPLQWAFLALGLTGVGLMMGLHRAADLQLGAGELFAFGSAATFSLGLVAGTIALRHMDVLDCGLWTLASTAAFTSIISLAVEPLPTAVSVTVLAVVVTAGVVAAFNAILALYGYRHVRVSSAGAILLTENVWAALAGAALYGEALTAEVAFGGALIAVSVLGSFAPEVKRPAPKDAGIGHATTEEEPMRERGLGTPCANCG